MVPCFSSLSPKDVPTPAALGGVQDGHGGLVPEPEGRPALEQAERGDEEALFDDVVQGERQGERASAQDRVLAPVNPSARIESNCNQSN